MRFARSRKPFAIETPIFIVPQADSHEFLEFPINRFARIDSHHATKPGSVPPFRGREALLFSSPHKAPFLALTHPGVLAFPKREVVDSEACEPPQF